MLLVFDEPSAYAETVWLALPQSFDSIPAAHVADPTDIDELRLYFLFPTVQPRKRAPRMKGHQMMRQKNYDGSTTYTADDGTDYVQAKPLAVIDENEEPYTVQQPWHRRHKKEKGIGRSRRLALSLQNSLERGPAA